MWRTTDYKGKPVKWYEAELIEKIRKIVQEQTNTRMLFADLKSYTDNLNLDCEFVCGYAKKDDKEKRLKAKIKSIRIINGKNTDLAINKLVYDIEFELLED